MQTDLQVLLLIVGVVFALYVIFSLFRRSSHKNEQEQEEFEQTVLAKPTKNHSHKDNERDPLLEGAGIVGPARKVNAQESKNNVIAEETDDLADNLYPSSANAHQHHNEQDMIEDRQDQAASFIAITVIAKNPNGFVGNALQNTLKANHFHYHPQGVFNRHVNDNPGQAVMFSVLSIKEPGVFDEATMHAHQFEGIVLLLVLQGNNNPSAMFEKMLTSARQLAVMLDGELCDDRRQPLTAHIMARLRERITTSHRRTLTQNQNGLGQQRA